MQWRLANDVRELRDLRRELTRCLELSTASGSDVHGAVLAAGEIVTNAIAYSDDVVDVTLAWNGVATMLVVADAGPGFDLDEVCVPEHHEASGRGLLIVRNICSELRVEPNTPQGSIVSVALPVRPRRDRLERTNGVHIVDERRNVSAPPDELSRFRLRPRTQHQMGLGSGLGLHP